MHKKRSVPCWWGGIGVFFLAMILHGCRSQDEKNIYMIFGELDHCPSWKMDDPVGRERILDCMESIRQYPLEDIREVVARASRIHLPREDPLFGDKIYILNRYLFNVPERYPRKSAKFFGGLEGAEVFEKNPRLNVPRTQDPNDFNLMWPLSCDKDGKIVLVGDPVSAHTGPSYDAIGEFDYFRRMFGLRKFGPSK